MNTFSSGISFGLIGFVAGIAFLISCGSDDTVSESNAAVIQNVVVLKDANGADIGRVIGMANVNLPYVLTDHGYRTFFDVATGRVEQHGGLHYESVDCTGTAYLVPGSGSMGNGAGGGSKGTVFVHGDTSELAYSAGLIFYTPHDAPSVTATINSQLNGDLTCNTLAFPFTNDMWPALPNEPSITGIQNTAYPTPMRIE